MSALDWLVLVRHADRDRRLRHLEDAAPAGLRHLHARRLRRQLGDDRPLGDGDAGERDHLSVDARPGLHRRHALPAVLLRAAAGDGRAVDRVRAALLRPARGHRVRVSRGALRSKDAPARGVPVSRAARALGRYHDLRAGDRALDGARLVAGPDLRLDRRARDPVHRQRRHARGQPDPEAPDGGDAGRDGGRVRRGRAPAAARDLVRARGRASPGRWAR